MRLFRPVRTHSKQLRQIDVMLCPVVLAKTELVIVTYDHVSKLALRICNTDMFALVEEIENDNFEIRMAVHEFANSWTNVTNDSRDLTRMTIAQLLSRYGYWSGSGPLEGSLIALRELA